ncbi:hypothetical protein PTTG_01797 [Puccinia triticina 1-1 BBBD Race 1]|uniref:Uncharacterized protein n=1 Tax=Puccinia triticina (isolate 1-1 / race 1 (BBBD)) TaxID=630390 RepID=A0A0C4EM08_PUCT1|nr:hypothetical protein PTTG_01797 [Puccinia triticina 1-1 BBBD Race 1]WAR59975.1 hypothetical protein PtB15_11B616 [Puccinia triticina]
MIIVKVLSSLPCSDENIRSDLARRLTISFKMCCGEAWFDPADLRISFSATIAHYEGATFLQKPATSPTAPVAMLYLDVIAPPAAEYGTAEFKTQLLTRLKKEVDDWISSSFQFKTSDDPSAQTAASGLTAPVEFSDVIPVIEYRQMKYGCHALDGNIVVSPYGVM